MWFARSSIARVDAYASGVPMPEPLGRVTLTDLVTRARANDRSAWEELVRRFERLVWKIAYSFDLDRTTREDVFQNTWLRLYQSLDTVREPEALPGWMLRTATNEARAAIRNRRDIATSEIDERPDLFAPQPDAGPLEDELRRAVALAFAELSKRCQQILRLLTADPPLSYAQIAETLNVTHGYVGPTRGRCIQELRSRPAMAPFLMGDALR
jgi:RNA polymerase sigma factor (sigma-70 family)